VTKPIIVGVDGSASSLEAVEWAAEKAGGLGVPLTLVYSWFSTSVAAMGPGVVVDYSDNAKASAEGILAGAKSRAQAIAPQVTVDVVSTPEPPGPALVDRSDDAREIAVGSRGLGGFASMLLGSVGLYVAGHATCPVVVVRGMADGRKGPEELPKILLGVDGSKPDAASIEYAFEEASRRGWHLEAVHAWTGAPDEGDEERVLSEALAGWREKYPDVQVYLRIAQEAPHRLLVDLSPHVDLVVVGADRRNATKFLALGHVNHALLHHSACPIAVVPEI